MNQSIHYDEWEKNHQLFLETFDGKDVVVLYSGGKDSSLALDFVLRASGKFNFSIAAHGSAFPMHRYPDEEKQRLSTYWEGRGVTINWHDTEETDDDIKDAANPCLPCQTIRKKKLKTTLPKTFLNLDNLVLVTSYSLWDIVSYTMEYLLEGLLAPAEADRKPDSIQRYRQTAQRFYPLVRMKEGYTVFRPILKYNQCDIVRKIQEEKIPILSVPCKYKGFRPKRNLEKYYEKMGLRFDYDRLIEFTKEAMALPDLSSYTGIEMEKYLGEIF